MRAIVVHETGGPEVLRYEEVEDPRPGPGELLVDVAAAGLNFIDTYHRGGLYPMEFPFTPGVEGAGTIVALGEGAGGLSVGDQVAWAESLGSYAELTTVSAEDAVPVLPGVGLDIAAAVILQGMTAHYLASDTFPLGAGHTCLIHAGAGGVGLLLTQIAVRAGARVITTVGSEKKRELSRAAGASDVIVYTDIDFKEAVEDLIGPNSLDVVYDGVGAATFDKGLELLRPRGMMVTFGNASGAVPEIRPLVLAQRGSIFLTRPTLSHYIPTRDELLRRAGDLFTWIDAGELEVRIGERFPLEEAAEAHRVLEGRRTTGKVLLVP